MKRRYFMGTLAMAATMGVRAEDDDFAPLVVTADVARRFALHAMLASNAYHRAGRVRFPVEQLGWQLVGLDGLPRQTPTVQMDSGLAYDIYRRGETDDVMLAFRGTDSKRDYFHANLAVWPFSGQYREARKAYEAYAARHPQHRITLTGHSLGGGLALGISVRHGVDAIVFDSSPRVFDGLGDNYASARRVMVYEGGEILSAVRKVWKRKFLHIVPRENIYRAEFDFGKANRHRSDHLALGLLNLGATLDPALAAVRDALPPAGRTPV